MKHPVIAIDGHAASGKGTLARRLAADFGMAYLDTGALYRYVALNALDRQLDLDDEAAVTALSQKLAQALNPAALEDPQIRSDATGSAASRISSYSGVRQALLDLQRRFAGHPPGLGAQPAKGAVLDGRDIGTVICPDAPLKLFVTARPDVRARRRWKELRARGSVVAVETVLADMLERDRRDSERAAAPLTPADDAIILDTSDMTVAEVLDFAQSCVRDQFRL